MKRKPIKLIDKNYMQSGGFTDPWQIVRPQSTPTLQQPSFADTIRFNTQSPGNKPTNPVYDYNSTFQAANTFMDLIGGIRTQALNAETAANERKRMYELMQPITYTNNNQYGASNNVLDMAGQTGGYFETGANNTNPNVVAEQNEVFEKNGQLFHIAPGMLGAQRHEDGGTPVNADRVLEATSTLPGRDQETDKLLQLKPDMAELLTGIRPTKAVSHATALKKADEHWTKEKERFDKKNNKILTNPDADKFSLASAKLNIMQAAQIPTTTAIFDNLFKHQEGVKQFHGIGNDANYAAKEGMQSGGYVDNFERTDWNTFIDFLKSKHLSGNASLDHGNNNTNELINEYRTQNPASILSMGMVPNVQQDFIDNGTSYGRTDLPISKKDGWVGSITSTYQYPTPAQPATSPGYSKSLSYEKLYDANGNMSYSPVFSGNWSYNDVKSGWKEIPGQINGVPVSRGQAWEDLWTGFTPSSNAKQWHKANATPVQAPNISQQISQPVNKRSKIKVSYGDTPIMQAGGQPERKEFQMPFQWMQQVPLFDMMNLSKDPEPYVEPQVHNVQLQGYSPTAALNRINADYRSAVNGLPANGTGMAAQAQMFANKARATSEEMDRTMQYNNSINNQNALYQQQYENQSEQARASALQNFFDRTEKRDAIFDTQKNADRDQWMHNLMNGWATDFAVNKLMPAMYPYYNYDGSPTGKKWAISAPGLNVQDAMMDSKGGKYELMRKPQVIKQK